MSESYIRPINGGKDGHVRDAWGYRFAGGVTLGKRNYPMDLLNELEDNEEVA